MPHVLILSLGPVQDFIAAARRCRDLWFGSWLLSELSKATARGVNSAAGHEALVFPSPNSELHEGSGTSVANKIVAIVPDGKSPDKVAEAAGGAMRSRLAELHREAFERIAQQDQDGFFDLR